MSTSGIEVEVLGRDIRVDAPACANTADKRKAIALRVQEMIDGAIIQRGDLPERWEVNEGLYYGKPQDGGFKPFEGAASVHINLVAPVVDALTGQIMAQVLSQSPLMSARVFGGQERFEDSVEQAVDVILRRAQFDLRLCESLRLASVNGVAIIRPRLTVSLMSKEDVEEAVTDAQTGGEVDEAAIYGIRDIKLDIDVLHPKQFVCYPLAMQRITEMRLCGHSFRVTQAEIAERQRKKIWFADTVDFGLFNASEDREAGYDEGFSLTNEESSMARKEDEVVELYCVYFKHAEEGKEERWYEAIVSKDEGALLDIREWEMHRPPYFDLRLHTEINHFLPASSLANSLQQIQKLYNESHNLLINGSLMAMFPTIFADIDRMGWDSSVAMAAGPGKVVPTTDAGAFQQLKITFDPGIFPTMLAQMEQRAYQTARVSPGSQAVITTERTTATEIESLNRNMASALAERMLTLNIGLGEFCEYVQILVARNFDAFLAVYGDTLGVTDVSQINQPFDWGLTGMAPMESTRTRMEALQGLLALSQNPVGASIIDVAEVIREYARTAAGRSAPRLLYSQEKVAAMQLQAQGDAGIPGMDALQGGLAGASSDPTITLGGNGFDGGGGVPQAGGSPFG